MYLNFCISSSSALASKFGAGIFTFALAYSGVGGWPHCYISGIPPSLYHNSVIPVLIQSKRPRAKLPSGLFPDPSLWIGQQSPSSMRNRSELCPSAPIVFRGRREGLGKIFLAFFLPMTPLHSHEAWVYSWNLTLWFPKITLSFPMSNSVTAATDLANSVILALLLLASSCALWQQTTAMPNRPIWYAV